MKRTLLLLSLVCALTTSCTIEPQTDNTFDPLKIELEVKSTLHSYYEDMAENGFAAEFHYLDSSDQFFWVPPGFNSALTFDSVATILKANEKIYTSISFKWESLLVHPLSEDLATYYGVVNGNLTDSSASQSNMRLIESGAMIKRKMGWKLLCGQSALIE